MSLVTTCGRFILVNSSLTYKITLRCPSVWIYSVAKSAVLADTRHTGKATCPDFKAWPQNLKMVKKSRNLDIKKTKNKGGGGTYDRLPLL